MRTRCNNPNYPAYKNYGGRGIRVCERWNSFASFLADMGPRPAGTCIERINNNGNYEPGNCRWATRREQSLNTRQNNIVHVNGQGKPLSEWAHMNGMDEGTFRRRLALGWTPERAASQPVRSQRNNRVRNR